MKSKSSGLWLFFAGFAVFTGIILSLVFPTQNGPNSSWIQAGAAVSLILVTWRYVALTNETLMESEKARLQSFVPLIVLRSRQYKSDQGTPLTETYLLNAAGRDGRCSTNGVLDKHRIPNESGYRIGENVRIILRSVIAFREKI